MTQKLFLVVHEEFCDLPEIEPYLLYYPPAPDHDY